MGMREDSNLSDFAVPARRTEWLIDGKTLHLK